MPPCNSVFRRSFRGSPWIFRIQAGGGHDGASEFFRRENEWSGRCWGAGILFGMGCDETIAPPYDSLQVLRLAGIVRQGAANFADSGIDPLFDIDEHILAPQCAGDLLARDQLPALFDQKHQ